MGVMILMIVVGMLIVLGLAALWWGVDTTDGPDSPEWERRRAWRGYIPAVEHGYHRRDTQ